ncbi:MAG: PAAR-like domain-containing protein, partial [Alcaligenes sp.]
MFMLNNAGAMTTATVPDVCLTPAVPSPIPMPYPNIAMSDMADPGGIVENVLVGGMPALNQASTIMLSNGDQGGVAGGGVACGE